jgi:ADP-ribose pyrophosphatase YjhB (NUDIX family)
MSDSAIDGEEMWFADKDQEWVVAWHPGQTPPEGKPHGAAGVCVTGDSHIVLTSLDGDHWDLPAGRPEGDETWEETLRREMLEEACAIVGQARLLGFVRSECVNGREEGLVIVRSMWRADVELSPWEPRFEIPFRWLVPLSDVETQLNYPGPEALRRMIIRAIREATLPWSHVQQG